MHKSDLLASPIEQFSLWFSQAQAKGEIEPSAMTLATVDKKYQVTARMVLLKSFDEQGFIFFTNYQSPKARALAEVPQAALVFWWPLSERQVRVTGNVSLVTASQSDAYFNQRNKLSRIAAIVSKQSEVIPDRSDLLTRFEAANKTYENTQTIPRPPYWGGYCLHPTVFEFWQGGAHRLHDRFQYQKHSQKKWHIVQLSP